jgi:hypothetical protein
LFEISLEIQWIFLTKVSVNIFMNAAELYPTLKDLPKVDKLKVMQFLVTELAKDEEQSLQSGSGAEYEILSPLESHEAVHKLGQLLESETFSIDLPSALSGKQVEVFVLSENNTHAKKKSLRGILKRYARPELIDLESSAWEKATEEKYGDR